MKQLLPIVLLFLLPVKGLVVSVGVVIIFDTITGIYRSVKLGGSSAFNSERLGKVVGKLILYNLAIISIFILDELLLGEFLKHWFSIPFLATKIVTMVLCFIEITSIKENIEESFGVDIFKLLKKFFQRTKELTNDIKDIKL